MTRLSLVQPHFCPDIERVPPGACPAMPPDNEQRWAARKELYNATRNREQNRTRALALSAGRNNQANWSKP